MSETATASLKELKQEMDAARVVSDSSWVIAIKASSVIDGSFNVEAAEAYLIYDEAYATYDAARSAYNKKLKEIADEDT